MVRAGRLIVKILLTGCLLPVALAAAAPAVAPAAEILRHAPLATRLQLSAADTRDSYRHQQGFIVQPDPYGEGRLRSDFELYRPIADRPAPLVLILPPYRGVTFADRGYAEALASAGINAAILAVPRNAYRQDAGIDYIDRFFVRYTLNLLTLERTLRQHPASPLRVTRSGLLGTSLGAIRGSIAFGAGPEFTAAVLIMPGGDLPSLIANTVLQPIERWREKFIYPELQDEVFASPAPPSRAERQTFETELRPHLHLDPLDFVRPNSHDSLLLVRSDNDSFVPRHNQDRLFAAYRKAAAGQMPQTLAGSGLGHYATILAVYNRERERIVAFLRQRLVSATDWPTADKTGQTCGEVHKKDPEDLGEPCGVSSLPAGKT